MIPYKICTKCTTSKPEQDFYAKSKTKTHSWCKSCFNSNCVARWIDIKIKAIELKGSKCVDCGISYPEHPYVIYDFHHVDPTKKDFDWTKLRLRSWASIVSELEKCVLLCGNCHRIRHHLLC